MGKVRVTPKRQLIVKQNATFGTKKPTMIKGEEDSPRKATAVNDKPMPPSRAPMRTEPATVSAIRANGAACRSVPDIRRAPAPAAWLSQAHPSSLISRRMPF
ncbi:hypothetical protein ACCO45_005157 [Purpureocillium lilacinum]|uniref:Uncharacterized protein n=1 Tax=Purpureocillium lilacinum TaxID=33203 RepID=A0ACC4DUN4_PURLI